MIKGISQKMAELKSTTDEPDESPTMKQMLVTFADETSMHGMKNVVHSKKHVTLRVLWVILLLGMAAYLTYTLVDVFLKYRTYPYTTSLDLIRQSKQPLPAVTVCFDGYNIDRAILDKMPNSQMLKEYLYYYTEEKSFGYFISWTFDDLTKTFGNQSFDDVFNPAFIPLKPSDAKVFIQGILRDDVFQVTNALNKECLTFNAAPRDPSMEFSPLTVTAGEYTQFIIQRNNPEEFHTDFFGGVSVFIHDPRDSEIEPTPEIVFVVTQGSLAMLTLKSSQYRFLPAPYRSFGGSDCIDTEAPGFKSPLGLNLSYSLRNCIYYEATRFTVKICNCIGGFLQDFYDLPVCTLAQDLFCFRRMFKRKIVDVSSGNETHLCLPPCSSRETKFTLTYISPFPSSDFEDDAYKTFSHAGFSKNYYKMITFILKYESDMITSMEHKPAISTDDIYSTLGGQMGFFLGASVLTCVEMLEAAFCLVWTVLITKVKGLVESVMVKFKGTTHVTTFDSHDSRSSAKEQHMSSLSTNTSDIAFVTSWQTD